MQVIEVSYNNSNDVYEAMQEGIYHYKNVKINITDTTFKKGILYIPKKVMRNWEAYTNTEIEVLYGGVLWKDRWQEYHEGVFERKYLRAGAISISLSDKQQNLLAQEAINSYIVLSSYSPTDKAKRRSLGEKINCDITYTYREKGPSLLQVTLGKVDTKPIDVDPAVIESYKNLIQQYVVRLQPIRGEQGIYWSKTPGWIPFEDALKATLIKQACYVWRGYKKETKQPVIYTGIVGDTKGTPKRSLSTRLQEHRDFFSDIEISHCMYECLQKYPDNISADILLKTCEARLQSLLMALLPCNSSQVTPLLPQLVSDQSQLPLVLNDKSNYHTK